MSNNVLLSLILASVVVIGTVVIHEANESPLEAAGEEIESFADDAGDAIKDATN